MVRTKPGKEGSGWQARWTRAHPGPLRGFSQQVLGARPGQAPPPLPAAEAETARAESCLLLPATRPLTCLCPHLPLTCLHKTALVKSTALESTLFTSCVTSGELSNLSEP